jgi:hypothetical protein
VLPRFLLQESRPGLQMQVQIALHVHIVLQSQAVLHVHITPQVHLYRRYPPKNGSKVPCGSGVYHSSSTLHLPYTQASMAMYKEREKLHILASRIGLT